MLQDNLALMSDLSWLSLSSRLDGDDASADDYENQANRIVNQQQTGLNWDSAIDSQ